MPAGVCAPGEKLLSETTKGLSVTTFGTRSSRTSSMRLAMALLALAALAAGAAASGGTRALGSRSGVFPGCGLIGACRQVERPEEATAALASLVQRVGGGAH